MSGGCGSGAAVAQGGSCDGQQRVAPSWRQHQGALIACMPSKSTGGRALVRTLPSCAPARPGPPAAAGLGLPQMVAASKVARARPEALQEGPPARLLPRERPGSSSTNQMDAEALERRLGACHERPA